MLDLKKNPKIGQVQLILELFLWENELHLTDYSVMYPRLMKVLLIFLMQSLRIFETTGATTNEITN